MKRSKSNKKDLLYIQYEYMKVFVYVGYGIYSYGKKLKENQDEKKRPKNHDVYSSRNFP